MEERIKKINEHLEKIGSKFRTEDGVHIGMFVGCKGSRIVFLRKYFDSIDDMEKFVFSVTV